MPIEFSQVAAVDVLSSDRHELIFPTIAGRDGYPLTIRHTTVTLPAKSIGKIRVKYLGHTAMFRGGDASDNVLSVSFYEDVQGTVLQTLLAWQQLVRNRETGQGGLKSEYAVNCNLHVYDTVGKKALSFTLYNVWPDTVNYPNFGEESEAAHVDVQFSVDAVDLSQSTSDGSGGSTGAYDLHTTGKNLPSRNDYPVPDPTSLDFGSAISNMGIDGSSDRVRQVLRLGSYSLTPNNSIVPVTAMTMSKFASSFANYF